MDGFWMVLPLALMMGAGYAARIGGILPRELLPKLNQLLFRVTMPALLFRTTLRAGDAIFADGALFFAVYASFFVTPVFAWGIARFFGRSRERTAVSVFVSFRSNNVFMGIPAIMLALGDPGLDSLSIFLAMGLIGYHVISIAWAQLVLSGGLTASALTRAFANVMRNPLALACFAGLAGVLLGFREMPNGVDVAFRTIGDSSSGLALLLLGASLDLKHFVRNLRDSWMDVLFKLFVHPALVWLAFLVWPTGEVMMQTVVLASALPVAVNCYVVADAMGMDAPYTAELIAASTLLSIVTLPFWLRVLGIG